MGHSPKAVLAYGYDLSDELSDLNDRDWWTDEDEDWCTSAERALLAAAGWSSYADEYLSAEQVMEGCGVELVRLDNDGDVQGVILAAKKHRTDWDDNLVIPHFVLSDNADERLKWALGVLGIKRDEALPEWILAAYYS